MPPEIALILTVLLIIVLFWKDSLRSYAASWALWVPSLWLLILGSRPVSAWLGMGAPQGSVIEGMSMDSMMEGSPVDRAVFLTLLVLGVIILASRKVAWGEVLRSNIWLILYLVYCGISILWSDYPFIASKRWIKALGDPIMVLVVVTEKEPLKALETIVKRCAFLLIPFSILFIKYYPHLGKDYDDWTGYAFYVGVTTNKNTLGLLCFAFGLFYFGRLVSLRSQPRDATTKTDLAVIGVLFLMFGYCMNIVNSKTPLLSLLLAVGVFTALGYQHIRRNFGMYTIAAILSYALLEGLFNVSQLIIIGSGRDMNLSGRTELWDVVLKMDQSPILGYGFESFWLGDRLAKLWEMYYFKPNMAHNGYLEIFLNLGGVGLGLFIGFLVSCYFKSLKALKLPTAERVPARIDIDRFRMAFLLSFSLFNVTEGGFRSLNFIYVFFLLFLISYPLVREKLPHPSRVGLAKAQPLAVGARVRTPVAPL